MKSELESAIREYRSVYQVSDLCDFGSFKDVIAEVLLENPDIFWFSSYSIVDECMVELHYTFSNERKRQIEEQIDSIIKYDFKLSCLLLTLSCDLRNVHL